MKEIYLAGGCFWGVDKYFSMLKGITYSESGYANGNKENPSYEDLINGLATHAEAVYLEYDDKVISLKEILEHFFRFVNPHTLFRQGNDIGIQYRSGIYFTNGDDEIIIKEFLNELEIKTNKKVVTECLPLKNYYKAEEYHQNYLDKNPSGYCHVDLNLLKKEERK